MKLNLTAGTNTASGMVWNVTKPNPKATLEAKLYMVLNELDVQGWTRTLAVGEFKNRIGRMPDAQAQRILELLRA